MKIKLSEIKVLERIRQDQGDLEKLEDSLDTYGLINPITVSENLELIAGHRRYQAAKALGWDEIECRVIPVKSKYHKLMLETEENFNRKDFTPEELIRFREMREYLGMSFLEKILYRIKKIIRAFMKWLGRFFS